MNQYQYEEVLKVGIWFYRMNESRKLQIWRQTLCLFKRSWKEEVRNPPTATHGYATDCYNTQGGANEDSELKNNFGSSNSKFFDFEWVFRTLIYRNSGLDTYHDTRGRDRRDSSWSCRAPGGVGPVDGSRSCGPRSLCRRTSGPWDTAGSRTGHSPCSGYGAVSSPKKRTQVTRHNDEIQASYLPPVARLDHDVIVPPSLLQAAGIFVAAIALFSVPIILQQDHDVALRQVHVSVVEILSQGWKIFEMGSELFVCIFGLPKFRSKNKA